MSALVGGCLALRVKKPQVGENPHVSVMDDSLFCLRPRRGGPWSLAAATNVE